MKNHAAYLCQGFHGDLLSAETVYSVPSEPLARKFRASLTEDESHPHGD